MQLLVTKRYRHSTATIPQTLLEYLKLSFSNKTYMLNVNFTESAIIWRRTHIFVRRNGTLSLPGYTDFTSGLENWEICLKLYGLLSFFMKISFIIGGDRSLLSQNISIARDWILLVWIKAEPSISRNSENYDCFSL